ncbi:hypothetical protein NE237_003157 [Protea cynaroides]|uniref:3-oxoacyl-[acyl-carrier-protein] reductase n=1 Tax=Protea cynaroides TaxID=273540 RepID=A0A9Q0KGA7_9MAGN|nr:hypothetical protein NE237_003157 [Protea cynaroides]
MADEVHKYLEPWRRLDGKVVMVTGASSGLGLEFCLDLAKAGCSIVAAARRKDRLVSLCNEINQLSSISSSSSSSDESNSMPRPNRAVAVELDVSANGTEIDASVQKAWDAFGRIDALINNAGVRGSVSSPLNLSEEEWNTTLKTNLTGSWLVSKYVCRRMRDANLQGSVINISSIAGLNRGVLPGGVAYGSSKAGLNTLTKIMALELGVLNIRVNSISPGLFRSEITEKLMEKEWLKKVALKTIPLRAHGTSDPALTSLVRYLIHDSSEYVTGNVFIVEAGATLTGRRRFESREKRTGLGSRGITGKGKESEWEGEESGVQGQQGKCDKGRIKDMGDEVQKYLEPWCRLDGKVVMVTGASSGLGREFCLDLAKAGCNIVAAARRKDRLVSLCNEINQLNSISSWSSSSDDSKFMPRPNRAVAVELDVSAKGTEIDASVQRAWDAFGRIDALVNNAGVRGGVSSSLNLSEEEWNNTFRTNLTGSWLVSKYVCRRMHDANLQGSVTNISSTAGLNRGALPGGVAYASSKAGLNTLTKIMALELGVHNIRVNSISPGLFRSEITEKLMEKEWLKKVALKIIPLREHGTSDPALTSLVRYLIHDSSEYVTGNVFVVEAGATLPGVPIFSSL